MNDDRPHLLPYHTVCEYTGKALVGALDKDEQLALCNYITELEMILTELDYNDVFGTEGWRHHFGLED